MMKTIPPHGAGDLVAYRGQVYKYEGLVGKVTKAGKHYLAASWSTHCADCGRQFGFLQTTGVDSFWPLRRCDNHRKKGSKVRRVHVDAKAGRR